MAKCALITGVTGQDGAYLARLLLDRGYRVVGASRQNATPSTWRLNELGIANRIERVPFELLEPSNIRAVLKQIMPDEIYNLAAQSFVQLSFDQPEYTSSVDALGVLRLLEQLQAREAVAVGLLTGNLQDGARIKLGYFGLFEYFKFGGFGDDHRNRDGVAQAALTAAEQHANGSFDPNRVWVIGDTPLDISCARAINAKVLAVATGLHPTQELAESQPDRLLEDLSDTNVVLNALS